MAEGVGTLKVRWLLPGELLAMTTTGRADCPFV
jgi:hypothetical protein